MSIQAYGSRFQLRALVLAGFLFALFTACGISPQEEVSGPPSTPLLARRLVGYAVILPSYARILDQPDDTGVALGYFRRSTVVRVLERRSLPAEGIPMLWVLVEDGLQGWLKADAVDLYENEGKARTAAESLSK